MQKRILLIILLLFSSVSFSNNSNLLSSGLPSLAPMLENVTPAVVNIYTINEVEAREVESKGIQDKLEELKITRDFLQKTTDF